jgi:hypothetical protein
VWSAHFQAAPSRTQVELSAQRKSIGAPFISPVWWTL